ncbi:MAG TPA: YfiR family protein [Steroidobacteraceae bacterium]|nr:YfiR family protein [Steroidobacteraceae bacterium]
MLRVCAFAILQLWLLAGASSAAPPVASEHEVKAAMLYRVAKFIEWPTQSFATNDAPFVVCVAGDENALRAFDPLNGRQLNGHSVVARRVSGDAFDLRQCHAAFFPRDTVTDANYALGKLQGMPVLTVGEAEDFAHRGGMLALITQDARVHFALNIDASKQAGLKVSAQLLQLATVVRAP